MQFCGFGAILISLMGYGVEQNGQEAIRNEKIIVIYVLHVMILNFVIHVASQRFVPNLKSVLIISLI